MAPYRRAYNFTGEPDANEDAADWLSALETNIYSCMTDREKVDLFSSKLWRGSPAEEWFNRLPDEGRQLWSSAKQEFESRWCKITAMPNLIALLSTDNPTNLPSAHDFSPLLETDTNDHHATPRTSTTLPPLSVPLKDPLPVLSKLLAAQDAHGVFDFCQQTANSEHRNFALVWNLAFQAGNSFAQQENASRKEPVPTTSEIASEAPSTVPILPPIPEPSPPSAPPTPTAITAPVFILPPPLPSAKLSWADDCTSLPVILLVKTPRDISCLRSGNNFKPFGTLQYRNRRHFKITQRVPVPLLSFPSPSVHTRTSAPVYLIPSRRVHSSPGSPAVHPNATPVISLALDWDHDPCLFELSRVLRSLESG